jgi:hypothetical protein
MLLYFVVGAVKVGCFGRADICLVYNLKALDSQSDVRRRFVC